MRKTIKPIEDLIYFYSSFWTLTTIVVKGTPLNVIQLD